MKAGKQIWVAFLLNLAFSIFELVGGLLTGSVAILSDALHDLSDAASIGIACLLDKKSTGQPDQTYTYGYARYSVIGGALTALMLLAGSVAVIAGAIGRLLHPAPIHYDGMILFAIVGVIVNLSAALLTRDGHTLTQRAVSLHMLEDVLGWIVVLIGAVVMRFTDLAFLDALMSIGVAIFIGINAAKCLWEALQILLEKAPQDVDLSQIEHQLLQLPMVLGVHHIHVWSMDGTANYATMHIVSDHAPHAVKDAVRQALQASSIHHVTLEIETSQEDCHARRCHVPQAEHTHHHHHHHHHG